MKRPNSEGLETCAQPTWDATFEIEHVVAEENSAFENPTIQVPEDQDEGTFEEVVDTVIQESPAQEFQDAMMMVVSPNDNDVQDCFEMLEQLNRAQTILVAMQAQCPSSRYCQKVQEDIDDLLMQTTVIVSQDLEVIGNSADDFAAMKTRTIAVLEKFREVKAIFDDIMTIERATKVLKRHATDDTDNENEDNDENSK
jgi:hypothetical protein